MVITLLIALSSRAQAESRQPWHAAATPPKPGLPPVTIDLGYPGPYVPSVNSPITLRATAAGIPFDGYIGYSFAVKESHTLDTPVTARAILRPRQNWSFSTTVNLRRWESQSFAKEPLPREVVIEWRTRALDLIGRQSAGTPPWTTFNDLRLPLRVGGDTAFGDEAYLASPDALSDRAQWYAGFSSFVVPTNTWLTLPKRIREAIFGSGINIVFIGLPRRDQQLDRLDRAILPVVFTARPGSYEAPWPYRGSRSMPIKTAMSWVAVKNVDFAGSANCPYIVRTNAAAWVADEVALSRPLPAMVRVETRPMYYDWFDDPAVRPSRGGESPLSIYRGAVSTGSAVLLSTTAWLLARRKRSPAIAASLVIIVCVVFAARGKLRPPSHVDVGEMRMPSSPGVIEHFREQRAYGPAPLSEIVDRSDRGRTSLTGDYGPTEEAEVRRSDSAPSMGMMLPRGYWDSLYRWTYRREIADSPATTNRLVTPRITDFHHPMFFFSRFRATGRDFAIEGRLKKEPDGRLSCVFALPPNIGPSQSAVISLAVTLAGSPVEIAWATGTTRLTPTRKDVYHSPRCEVPPDILRDIVAHGGIVTLTLTPEENILQPFLATWIHVQEKKS